nr:hypothetical protein HK105_005427 [Polyrhizophydium stewartii]
MRIGRLRTATLASIIKSIEDEVKYLDRRDAEAARASQTGDHARASQSSDRPRASQSSDRPSPQPPASDPPSAQRPSTQGSDPFPLRSQKQYFPATSDSPLFRLVTVMHSSLSLASLDAAAADAAASHRGRSEAVLLAASAIADAAQGPASRLSRASGTPTLPWEHEYAHIDTDWSMQAMDVLYNASFYDYIRDERNLDLTAPRLARLVKEYKPKQVATALRWMVQGWSVQTTARLLATPQIGLCVAYLLHVEPPAVCALFVRSLGGVWGVERTVELIGYLDGMLEWDEPFFREFIVVYSGLLSGAGDGAIAGGGGGGGGVAAVQGGLQLLAANERPADALRSSGRANQARPSSASVSSAATSPRGSDAVSDGRTPQAGSDDRGIADAADGYGDGCAGASGSRGSQATIDSEPLYAQLHRTSDASRGASMPVRDDGNDASSSDEDQDDHDDDDDQDDDDVGSTADSHESSSSLLSRLYAKNLELASHKLLAEIMQRVVAVASDAGVDLRVGGRSCEHGDAGAGTLRGDSSADA